MEPGEEEHGLAGGINGRIVCTAHGLYRLHLCLERSSSIFRINGAPVYLHRSRLDRSCFGGITAGFPSSRQLA